MMKKNAYTIVELSIVILVIGIILITGSNSMGWLINLTQTIKSEQEIKAKNDSIINFAINEKKLPTQNEFDTLGSKNKDIWQKDLSYIYDDTLTTLDMVCNKKTTTLSLSFCDTQSCETPIQTINNIAYLIHSNGYNQVLQTNLIESNIKIYNNLQISNLDYDDIIYWASLDDLRIKALCDSKRLSLLNNELSFGYTGTTYTTTIYAKGGVPFTNDMFQWSYSSTPQLTCNTNLDINNQAQNLELTCINPDPGVYLVNIVVSDDDGNSFNKDFALTINY